VLAEHAADWFDCGPDAAYMLTVHPVRDYQPQPRPPGREALDLIEIVRQTRSRLAAVTHVDGSARVQALHRDAQPDLHDVIGRYAALTGVPVLLNTSFNMRGEPIVLTPRDALACFGRTEMDLLAIEDFLVPRSAQTAEALAQFGEAEHELD
jgi:carbamoyltransferase